MKRETIIERKARRGLSPYTMNEDLHVPPWAIESARRYNAHREFRDQVLFFVLVGAVIFGFFVGLFFFASHWV